MRALSTPAEAPAEAKRGQKAPAANMAATEAASEAGKLQENNLIKSLFLPFIDRLKTGSYKHQQEHLYDVRMMFMTVQN